MDLDEAFYALANRAKSRKRQREGEGEQQYTAVAGAAGEGAADEDDDYVALHGRVFSWLEKRGLPAKPSSFYGRCQSARKEGCTMRMLSTIDPSVSKVISRIPYGAGLAYDTSLVLPRDPTDEESVDVTRVRVVVSRETLKRFLKSQTPDDSYVDLNDLPEGDLPGFVRGWVSLNAPYSDETEPIVNILASVNRFS